MLVKLKVFKIFREGSQRIFHAGRGKELEEENELSCQGETLPAPKPLPTHSRRRLVTWQSAGFPDMCPAPSSSADFNRCGLLWCFWGVAHPLWVWLRSLLSLFHFVVETQCHCHYLFWRSVFLALFEGWCWWEPLNDRSAWEICSWFGHILDLLSLGRGGRVGASGFAHFWPCLMNHDGFNLFLFDPHVDLCALHTKQNMTERDVAGLPRHFNGVLVEVETDPSLPPTSCCSLFFLPPFSFHSHSLFQTLPQQEGPNYRDIRPMLKTW